jgi:hypothetical protein
MPSDIRQNHTSRRAFLGAAAAGAASLSVAAAGQQPTLAAEPTPGRSTVRDRLWLFTVAAGPDNGNLEAGGIRGGSRMTPAEGAFFLDIPNLLLIRSANLPALPCDEKGRTKTSYEQYAISFRPLDRVIWSVVGSGGVGGMDQLEYVVPLAKKYSNIRGIYLDDFIVDQKKQADGRSVGRPALSPDALQAARQQLKSIGRPMDIWVTLYCHELVANHPNYVGSDPPLASYLDRFDVLTLWTWNSEELRDLDKSLAALEAIAPKHRRIALGMYVWDYSHTRPMPLELMRHQCELGLRWLKEKRIQELIFLGNGSLDIGAPSAEFSRDWVAKVGHEPLE